MYYIIYYIHKFYYVFHKIYIILLCIHKIYIILLCTCINPTRMFMWFCQWNGFKHLQLYPTSDWCLSTWRAQISSTPLSPMKQEMNHKRVWWACQSNLEISCFFPEKENLGGIWSMAMQQEPIDCRYLPYIRPMEYPCKIWPYMVQYLHFRILKISH